MVIYVDDDKDDADILREVLRALNEDCIWHQEGSQIFEPLTYQPSSVSFLLLDIDMPIQNGFEILAMARNTREWSDIPIIVFSGSISAKDITNAFAAGATYYIQKPSTFRRLEEIVQFLINVDWKSFVPTPATFVYKQNGNLQLPDHR